MVQESVMADEVAEERVDAPATGHNKPKEKKRNKKERDQEEYVEQIAFQEDDNDVVMQVTGEQDSEFMADDDETEEDRSEGE